ncbi:hypothetical protein DKX38_012682 [Salix brachista]|uniref:Uncharacterized protein n=1 Tax=Salix brachista TaxID=2182728 RepID=A0A5N5LPI8_9ROSI|nr:hypothetical protein DKX38_012682 [Salix brachista]
MASTITAGSIHSPINASRLSSPRLSRNRVSPSNVLFKTSSLSLPATKATRFSFPPFPESGKSLVAKTSSFPGWTQQIRLTSPVVVRAAADAEGSEFRVCLHGEPAKSFGERFPTLVTGFFFFTWYFLNVIFNILNKKIFALFAALFLLFIYWLEWYIVLFLGLLVCRNKN